MADSVSKLYAEIGFKVNKDGLKQAQSMLKELANQLSAINNITKKAAQQYGIFSKDKNKQAMADAKLATETERAEVQRNKRRLENKKFEHKQVMDLAKLEFQVEKYNASEKQKIERRQAQEAEKAAKAQKKRLNDTLNTFRSFAVGLRNTFIGLAGAGAGGLIYGMKQSLNRSIPTRNFLMSTGTSLSDLQGIMQRIINTGSGMSQQQIMGDIMNVSQNLEDIRLGGGGIVPYKLMGVAATGNVMNVIKATEEAIKGMNNATALNLIRRMGLSDDWLAMWRFNEREGGNQYQVSAQQQAEIIETQKALQQLKFSFKNLADISLSVVSPAIQKMADATRDWLQSISQWINEHPNTIKELMDDLNKFSNVIKLAFGMIASVLDWFAQKIGSFMSAPKKLWEQSDIAKYFRSKQVGGMSKMDPKFEDELLKSGSDIVKDFNTDRRISNTPVFNNNDHSVSNVTINGVAQEEIANQVKEVIEEEKTNKQIWGERFSDISDLWVVGKSSGNASVG